MISKAGLVALELPDTLSPLPMVTAATVPLIVACNVACARSDLAVATWARSVSMVAWSEARSAAVTVVVDPPDVDRPPLPLPVVVEPEFPWVSNDFSAVDRSALSTCSAWLTELSSALTTCWSCRSDWAAAVHESVTEVEAVVPPVVPGEDPASPAQAVLSVLSATFAFARSRSTACYARTTARWSARSVAAVTTLWPPPAPGPVGLPPEPPGEPDGAGCGLDVTVAAR